MTDVLAALTPPRGPEVKRDRWGRYRIPHPVTGREQSWTRATTLANTLADRYGLEQWAKRNVALGIGARSDLYAQAASCTPDDKDTLTQIVAQAEEAASAKAKANLGTALHRFTERIDAGEHVDVPEPWRADVDAYRAVMNAAGLTVLPGWIERVLLVPDIDCAGTCDRILNTQPLPRVGDLKTGADVVRYGMTEIALQLAIYAHATHWFDPATGQLHPMPEVDQDTAVVMHLPVGKATCTLYEVDIAAGWEAVQLAVAVRDWRKRKDLAVVLPTVGETHPPQSGSADPVDATGGVVASTGRVTWLRRRIGVIVDAGHEPALAGLWDIDQVPAPIHPNTVLTDPQVDLVVEWCAQVEAAVELPFPDIDPLFAAFAQATAEATVAPRVPPAPCPVDGARGELARHWTDQAWQMFDAYELDQPTIRAVIKAAGMDGTETMTKDLYVRLAALTSQVTDVDGAVLLHFEETGPVIVPSPDAETRMTAAAGTRGEARDRAARLAKQMGHIAPRSLAKAAENPLLAALVAAGHGADNNNQSKEQEQ